jgi:hypothetical protein
VEAPCRNTIVLGRGRRRPDALITESPYCGPILSLARTLFGPGVEFGDREYKFVRRHATGQYRVEHPTARVAEQVGPDQSENRQTEPDIAWVFPDPAAPLLDNSRWQSAT